MSNRIVIQKGNAFAADLEFTDETVTPAIPLNLTGKEVKFTVKKRSDKLDDDTEALITKDWSTHTLPLEGKTTLNLTVAETDVEVGEYLYDFKIDGICTDSPEVCEIKKTVTTR